MTLRRFRVLLPPTGILLGFFLTYLLALLPTLLLAQLNNLARIDQPRPDLAVLVVGVMAFGTYRALAFHPVVRTGYRRWLSLGPWQRSKPLPAGPVGLVWEDGALVLASTPLARALGGLDPLALPILFLSAYLLALAPLLNRVTRGWPFGYAIAFGLGLVVRMAHWPPAALAVASATYLVAWLGLQRSLERFRGWDTDRLDATADRLSATNSESKALGWPYDVLSPRFPGEPNVRTSDAVLSSLLAGWVLYALTSVLPAGLPVRTDLPIMVLWTVIVVLAFARISIYVGEYRPPLTLVGRIATLRPILPGYDRVFLAPLATLLVGLLVPGELRFWAVPRDFIPPITLTLAMLVGLLTGPRLREWRLTGTHRIVPRNLAAGGKDGPFVNVG